MLTPRHAIAADGLRLDLAAICAIPCGLAVVIEPTGALLLASVAIGSVMCALLPIRHLPALLLAVTVVMPSLVLESFTGSGQARAVTLLAGLVLVRILMSRESIVVPGILPLAVGTTLGLTLLTALIATSRPATQVGSDADLVRDLSLPLAAVTGFAGGVHARVTRHWLAIPRAFACLGLVAALASVGFWAWRDLHLSLLNNSLFQQLAASSSFGKRSVFPFTEDSPNTAAVMFVLLCAFAAPPLLLEPGRRDRVLGMGLVAGSLAGVLSTQSRTGLTAAGAAAVAYLVLVKRGGGKRSTVLIVLVLLSSVGAYVFGTFPSERASGDTLQARTQVWGQAARAFLNDPLIGHGYKYSETGNFVEAANDGAVSHNQSTHSDILSHLVDGGVVGTAFFIVVFGLMFALARRSVADRVSRPLGIGYSCMLIAMIVSGVDNTLSESAAVITFEWLAFGVMAGMVPSRPNVSFARPGQARRHDGTWLRASDGHGLRHGGPRIP